MTQSPHTLIQPLARAGVKRFTFQYEVAEGGVFGDFYWGEGMKGGNDSYDDDIKYRKSEYSVGNIEKHENKNINNDREINHAENSSNDKRGKQHEINGIINRNDKINDAKNVEKRGAIKMAIAIREAGMLCGVCIAPNTTVAELEVVLDTYYCTATGAVRYENGLRSRNGRLIESEITSLSSSFSSPSSSSSSPSSTSTSFSTSTSWEPLVDYVDLLAVMPGVGGQRFDHSVLEKVNRLLFFILNHVVLRHPISYPTLLHKICFSQFSDFLN